MISGCYSAVILLLITTTAYCSDTKCVRRPIETSRESGVGDGGFRIRIMGDPPSYRPEQVYMISLEASVPNQKIANFQLISAKQQEPFDESADLGRFMYAQSLTIDRSFLPPGCSHIFGGRLYNRRSAVVVSWRAPPTGSGCVEFRALVSEFTDVWYKDAGGLTKTICEDTDDPLLRIPKCCACGVAKYQMTFEGFWSRETHPRDFPNGQNEGLLHWSNIVGASHDRTYSIWRVGEKASKGVQHTCELGDTSLLEREMRRKGEYIRSVVRAPGVWSRNLRQNRFARFSVNASHHLISMLTMIGPSPDWCVGVSSVNLCLQNCTWARRISFDLLPFDAGTDSGVTFTSENMPTKPQDVIRYLTNSWPNDPASPFFGPDPIFPFARVTFDRTSPGPNEDSKCLPDDGADEKSAIDSQDSSCVTSPWSEWGPCSTTCGVGVRVRNRMLKAALGGCSHIQTMEKEPCVGAQNLCADGKPATSAPETEQGNVLPEIHPPSPSRTNNLANACELTEWSDWSPCSVTCGPGLRRRTRQFANSETAHLCTSTAGANGRHLEETQPCINTQFPNCSTVNQLLNYAEICKLPAVRGPCTGNFPRWFYDPRQNRCIAFSYGGCRGNQNRFFSRAQCAQLCSEKGQSSSGAELTTTTTAASPETEPVKIGINEKLDEEVTNFERGDLPGESLLGYYPSKADDDDQAAQQMVIARNKGRAISIDCEVTQWTSWSSCSASCGRGAETRQRHVLTPPSGGGTPCPNDLAQRRNCRNPYRPHCEKKPINCQLGGWAEWSECTAGCLPASGQQGIQPVRTRMLQIISRARYGGRPCPLRGERTQRQVCTWLPVCADETTTENSGYLDNQRIINAFPSNGRL